AQDRAGAVHVALRLVVLDERVQRARVLFLEMVRLSVVLDRLVVLLLQPERLAQLEQGVEVSAVPLQGGAEVAERLVVASLRHGHEPARVLLLDLLVPPGLAALAPAVQERAELAGQPRESRDRRPEQEEHEQREADGELDASPEMDGAGQDLA